MIQAAKAAVFIRRFKTAVLSVAVAGAGLTPAANATEELSQSALIARQTLVAMTLADAAMPAAIAITALRADGAVVIPASLTADASGAMASMRTSTARRDTGTYRYALPYARPRLASYRDPFPLILGIGF